MFYYKTNINNKIYYFTSSNFCYYNEKYGHLVYCDANDAQYVLIGNNAYRIDWLRMENPKKIGSYPTINVTELTKEEYDKEIALQKEEKPSEN
jgi:hypothetical protein